MKELSDKLMLKTKLVRNGQQFPRHPQFLFLGHPSGEKIAFKF